ncbi:MAG: choice-of-anchor J domain-containing protein, partial [Bacteroidales bacterium]|nr:choice-of-anchor J domain-containing protein [Bacteroidales bacterium]
VSGYVYDTDVDHPVAFATVGFLGLDEYMQETYTEFTTDEEGFFTGELLAGLYAAGVISEGYATEAGAQVVAVEYGQSVEDLVFITHEFYYPLNQITATEEENGVLVEWSWDPAELIVDFETGDFSQAEFTLPATYPWAITTTNPYEGTYCMKSTCEGVASGISAIEVTVDVPYDGLMGFWVKVSSEQNYDKFHFYIDGVEMGSGLSGQAEYAYKEYAVTEGTHTYKFEYAKDSSVNSNDDCIYVDNVTLYKQAGPAPSGMTYTFDDNTMMGWTSLDADGDGNGWVSSANPGIYHNSGVSLSGTGHNDSEAYVISGSYANQTGQALTPDNYLVSPAKIAAQNGAAISFYACAQDESYAAEHFGVAVSTGSNTSAADFTTVQEWTMTAKNGRGADEYSAVRGTRQGSWYQYTVDLSAYAGQEIWVAIRHFNCTDMFILNVDDITLGDGSEAKAPRNDRTFQSFNVYRRNNVDAASVADPELIVEGTTDFEYTDAAWETLEFGEWQWGVAATYEGYAPVPERSRETATYGFEDGANLEGWTNIVVNTDGGEWLHSSENLGGYDYTELAHTGTGFAMCYSYVDYQGAYNTDAYLVSPQKYSVDASSTISFWADNANDSYPENFSVCVSTAANPAASDFVQIWNGGAKGANVEKAAVRRSDNRYENWRSHEISLAAYAGQEIWIAFHDVNYDQYEIWIDDVTITYAGGAPVPPTPGPTGSGISEIIWSNVIDKDMEATLTFNVSLNNGQSPEGATIAVVGENNTYNETVDETGVAEMVVRKGDTYNITIALEGYTTETTSWIANTNAETFNVTLVEIINNISNLYVSPTGWAMWESTGGVTPPTPPTPGGNESFTEGFEGGLNGWNVLTVNADGGEWIHSDDNLGGYDYTELAHDGTGFAMCYSYVDYVGAFNTDSYLYTPQKYAIQDGSTLSFWADNANDSYPENFSVCVATADNPTAADFTQVWSGGAKGTGSDGAMVRHNNNRYENWRSHSIDLSAYAGQEVYIAFHDVNYDAYEIWIDDVELGVVNKGNRAPLSYKVMLDGTYVGESYYPFYQHDVDGMEEGEVHVTSVAPLYASGMGEWMEYTWTYTSCSQFSGVTEFTSSVVDKTVTLNWTLPGGGSGGSASTFTEGFEGGMPEGWTVVDANNDGYTWCMTSNIPSTWTYYASLTLDWYRTGTNAICSGSYINGAGALNPDEYLVMGQQNIANGSTLSFWAAATDASYPADHFGVAVSDDATSWTMVQEWTLTGKEGAANGGRESRNGNGAKLGTWYNYTVDLSAYAGQKYIAIRHFNCYDQYIMCVDDIELGVANKGGVRSSRDMWDLLGTFNAAEGGHYGVVTDGEYIYTSNWGYSSAAHNFYKYDMDGNVIEGFEIPGCGTLRGMTFDGQYVYGVANSSTIYCVDLNNHTLVGTTTSAYGAMRGITYDPARDGFWVIGNWSGNLTLIDRTGAIVQAGPAPTSASDLAYYADPDGVEHVFCFNNGTNDVDDYNIATNTITPAVFNFNSTPGYDGGSSGGCHVATYAGKTAFFGDLQQSPNLIGIYELDGNAPVPPTPVEGIIGAVLFRDGEFVGMFGANTTTYTEELEEAGQYTYTIRVIYDGEPDVTYYAMSCGDDETVTIIDAVEDNDEVISSIYPNPTSGDLYITATAMKHVTVFNTMGQVVFSSDVNTDSYVLNMGQLEAGVYMVKVDAAQGSSVKRIAVVK